ncbi:MAG: tRNA (adenosine(37)-N6)-threonylcarbamoyltransferase complex dimerization subunit type 1 TsaB [Lachnospiraceae bacterium]|nr:tRNA (adenosine(37)-N6)-threonylcarbamoyltransferase complex dimerization subunit type 1 TsaB [Lachnospiraceae bacterium]
MNLIAIDSSGMTATVSLMRDGVLAGTYTNCHKKTHSETLLPMLEELGRMTEYDNSKAEAIAVAAGPGSFTGLRIGAALAKGMAEALGIPVIAVPTLEAMAYQFYGAGDFICPMMDARRNQVYSGIYSFEYDGPDMACRLKEHKPQDALDVAEQCRAADEIAKESLKRVIFLGDGIPVYRDIICENMKSEIIFAPAHRNAQDAACLAALAEEYYRAGKITPAEDFAPEYLRVSQAERVRREQNGD